MLCLEVDPGSLEFEAGAGRRDLQKEMACAASVTESFFTYLYCAIIAQTHQFAASADVTGKAEVLRRSDCPGTGGHVCL